MKTIVFPVLVFTALLFVNSTELPPASQVYQFNYENVLGTSFEFKVAAVSEQHAEVAEQVALQEIDRLNGILSTYDPASEVSQWQRTLQTDIPVSPELFEVLTLFDAWKLKTGGALNASAAIASKIWEKASLNQSLPCADELAFAVVAMNRPHWELNQENQTARHLSTDPLVFNSFVKSYIMSSVSRQVMNLPGISGSVINIGGDIVVAGNQQERIWVTNPLANAENDKPLSILTIRNKAIATSGNYRRGFQIGGQWFSHILDVRTGSPVSDIIHASVVGENAIVAGALATAFNILSPAESAALAKQIPGVEYQIITKTGQRITSDGWNALEVTPSEKLVAKESVNGKFELTIELELARFEGRFRRPFVAVWIEDKKKEPVRTLALWYNKPRWLPDLKRWYSKHQSVNQSGTLESISSATRSPGRYTLTWDGLNSEGKAVPSGKYTVYIEAAREHGTYQLMKQEVDWNGKSMHLDLSGGTEVTAASLDYHKLKN